MSTSRHTPFRMPRLAAAAVGLGAAACVLAPGAAFAAPAHGQPSGHVQQTHVQLQDKHWQAQADPDGSTNGGVDQPGGRGGTVGAQDGNNGSGNDADCEDDNRGRGIPGHCKPRTAHPEQGTTPSTPAHHTPSQDTHSTSTPTRTTPSSPVATVKAVVTPEASTPTRDEVLAPTGTVVVATPAASRPATASPTTNVLPNTGAADGLLWMAVGGAVALAAGGRTVLAARRVR